MNSKQQYSAYCKPKLGELLSALKLDVEYTSARGNHLYTEAGDEVLDFIGGFGAATLGHNHPELVETAVSALRQGIPINAQSSIRGETAELAKRLNDLTPEGHDYYVNFTNSGAESVEAAIKHAYKVQFDKVRREYENICRVLNDFYHKIDSQHLEVELPTKKKDLTEFRDDVEEYNLAQFESFQNRPVMIAFKGSFHGKTSAALKVTFNKSYREAFEGLSSIQSVYIDPARPERIPEIANEQVCTFYYPVLEDNKVVLRAVTITKVIGLVFELVQGEGGIRPLPAATLQYLADNHSRHAVPYILDEIQTGCGRMGSIFAYEKTPLAASAPEYITISKALGGGLVKIGATLIRKDIYDQDFGILHTSTFCEDEFSSRIAIKVLDLLTQDQGALLRQATEKGEYLAGKLGELRAKYPTIVKDVRGIGLMMGMEFTPLTERSPFFRASGRQGVLSLLIASYLLEHHHIRLLAPLSTMLKGNPGKLRLSILRIQPPLTITHEEMDRLIAALDEVLQIIQNNNEYCLMAHLAGVKVPAEARRSPTWFPVSWPVVTEQRHIDARIGFVVHPPTLDNLFEYYFPSFSHYPSAEFGLRQWWNHISRFLEPIHVRSTYVESNDFVLENNMVFVPYLPEYITKEKPLYLLREMQDKVQDAVTLAKELGDDNIPISMVGLGAYTSIITRNGETVNDYEVPVTTGNAYTTALTVSGIIHSAQLKGLDLSQARVAVVGATGNIGTVLAQILAPNVGSLKLVGRGGRNSLSRLRFVRQYCWGEILKTIQQQGYTQLGEAGRQVFDWLESGNPIFAPLLETDNYAEAGKQLEKILALKSETGVNDPPVTFATDLDNLLDCDVVVVATNSHETDLIKPDKVKPGAIVCCASVPSNLSREFLKNTHRNLAFDGGLARLPENSTVDFVGMPGGSLAYGCLAETFLLGFDGQNHSFSKGALTVEQVYRTMELADLHGFALGELKLHNSLLDSIHPTSAAA